MGSKVSGRAEYVSNAEKELKLARITEAEVVLIGIFKSTDDSEAGKCTDVECELASMSGHHIVDADILKAVMKKALQFVSRP